MKAMEQKAMEILASLVEQWQDRLFRFAYMRIGIREEAEDLLQDVFLKLYAALQRDSDIKDAGQYLLRSVANACNSYHRRHNYREPLERAESLAVDERDREIHEEFLRIQQLMQHLPPEQAETVRMKCYDGLTFKQIAEIEGIPEATAKSRYRYAISTLQKLYRQ